MLGCCIQLTLQRCKLCKPEQIDLASPSQTAEGHGHQCCYELLLLLLLLLPPLLMGNRISMLWPNLMQLTAACDCVHIQLAAPGECCLPVDWGNSCAC